jgi:Aspartyl protease
MNPERSLSKSSGSFKMKRLLLIFAAVCLLLVPASVWADVVHLESGALGGIEDEYAPKEVPAQVHGDYIFVDVLLNGKVRVKMVFDSGASYVVLSKHIADRLEVDLDKLRKGFVVAAGENRLNTANFFLKSIEILGPGSSHSSDLVPTGIKAENVETVFALTSYAILPMGKYANEVSGDGYLGASFLRHFQVTLDYQNRKITFQKNR